MLMKAIGQLLKTQKITVKRVIKKNTKGGRLSKIKKMFRSKICDSTHFFFEGMSEEDTMKLIKILN